MTLKITRINEEAPNPKVKVNQRLYRTNDGRLVPEGHSDAAFLFCAPGREVAAAEFEALTLDVGERPQVEEVKRADEPAGEDEGKGDAAADEKADEPGGDKRRKAKTEDK